MSRLKQITKNANQKGRKLLIPYLVAGDPNKETTIDLMHALVSNGADIIELGIPFSDPSSDGEVIQSSIERSLRKGTSLNDTLDIVAKFRTRNEVTPIVLMGYLNPVEIMGIDNFVRRAQKEGVDGVLMVDMPPAEAGVLNAKLKEANVDSIFLVAPTTTQERVKSILNMTSGYVYYVSLKGVTGASITDVDEVERNVSALRTSTDLPIVVGFGIKDGKSA
ncbi:MAG: tryptophan synthase subunit alpha, partial [Pseudohongiellaceae bacterium]